jgi:hypothetical protein
MSNCNGCGRPYHGSSPCYMPLVMVSEPVKLGGTIPLTEEQLQDAADRQLHTRLRGIGLDDETAWKALRLFRSLS